ncbi:hypothetical protein D5W64_13055 [Salmonella enterica subsp. enterica serovar Saintpaul]|nr:hypothetical protein [Salmonella enterica subsp. enterica serovar Saintpaul]
MSHIVKSNLQEFLKDVRENPDSFIGLHYPTLIKAINDIENRSLSGNLITTGLLLTERFKPQYRLNMLLMTKPGFKDTTPKILPGVTIDLYSSNPKVERIQLLICASNERPVHYALRIKFKSAPGWVTYPITASQLLTARRDILNM